MSRFSNVNLLITGQIRDRSAFERLLSNVRFHHSAFGKLAFSTWTQEIQANSNQIVMAESILEVLDAGNLLPVSPALNRDIIGVFAQSRQLFRGIDHFQDGHPIFRIRADDPLCERVNLTQVVQSVASHWQSVGKITTVVKASTAAVPCFLDDRLYIISPAHILLLKSFSFSSLLELHHRNLFPEFVLFAPLFQNKSKDLDQLLTTDVRSLLNQLDDMRDLRRLLSRTQLVQALRDYKEILSSCISYFADAIPVDVQNESGFSQYLLEAKRDVGPTDLADANSTIESLVERVKRGRSEPVTFISRNSYDEIENLKSLIALKFAKEDYIGAIKIFESSIIISEKDPHLLEQIGISYFKLGDFTRSCEVLQDLHTDGGRTFYHLFYLSAALVELKDHVHLGKILDDMSQCHGTSRIAADHILNCAMHFENAATRDYFAAKIADTWHRDEILAEKAACLRAAVDI